MNAYQQLEPIERIRIAVVRAQAALVLGDRDELRRFLDEMRAIDGQPGIQEKAVHHRGTEDTEKARSEAEPAERGSESAPQTQTVFTYDDVLAYVKERLAEGISHKRISQETKEKFGDLGVCVGTISNYVRRWKESGDLPVMKRKRRVDNLTSDEVVFIGRLLKQGVNPAEIARRMAEKFGPDRAPHHTTIYKYRKQWHLEAPQQDVGQAFQPAETEENPPVSPFAKGGEEPESPAQKPLNGPQIGHTSGGNLTHPPHPIQIKARALELAKTGLDAKQIHERLTQEFPEHVVGLSTIHQWLHIWRDRKELPPTARMRARAEKCRHSREDGNPENSEAGDEPPPLTKGDRGEFSGSAGVPAGETADRLEGLPHSLITTGRLADLLGISDSACEQQALFGNWPRLNGQFIIDRLPEDIKKTVRAVVAKEAA